MGGDLGGSSGGDAVSGKFLKILFENFFGSKVAAIFVPAVIIPTKRLPSFII